MPDIVPVCVWSYKNKVWGGGFKVATTCLFDIYDKCDHENSEIKFYIPYRGKKKDINL